MRILHYSLELFLKVKRYPSNPSKTIVYKQKWYLYIKKYKKTKVPENLVFYLGKKRLKKKINMSELSLGTVWASEFALEILLILAKVNCDNKQSLLIG